MAKAKGRARRTRRLVDKSTPPDDDDRFKPYRIEGGARDESRTFDLIGCRVFHGVWFDQRGRVTDFCFCLQVDDEDGEWFDIVRIDCCHGEAHIHKFNPDGSDDRRVLREIHTQDDVEHAYTHADDLIYDRWETALERWHRGG